MEPKCDCVVKNRKEGETQREWFKRWMCQWHWMETDYYRAKLEKDDANPDTEGRDREEIRRVFDKYWKDRGLPTDKGVP